MRKAFLAIPTISGLCTQETEGSIAYFKLEAASVGWEMTEFRWAQDSLIAHARNVCVAKFLESDATDLFFLDSDVCCGPGVFTRLMTHAPEFVCAVYRAKCEEERYPVTGLDNGATQDLETGLLEVKDVPFGFVRLKRSAIEKMVKHYPDWFHANHPDRFKCPALFQTVVRDNTFWGEDFFFCRLWREMGGRIYVDPEINLAHINGNGKAFAGSLGKFLRSKGCTQDKVIL